MDIVLLDEVVYTDYGQFDLVWAADDLGFDGEAEKYFRGQVNGLVGAAHPDGLYLHLARRSGGSRMLIKLVDAAPSLHPAEFHDVVEVSIRVPSDADPRWETWAGESGGPLLGLGAGDYRVRVSAKGRDEGAGDGEFADGVVDEYVVEIWAAVEAPDEILRAGSANADYWHREWGGRR